MHTHSLTCMHTGTRRHTCIHMHTCTHIPSHACSQTHIDTHVHLHTCTQHIPPAPHACRDVGSQLTEVTTQDSQDDALGLSRGSALGKRSREQAVCSGDGKGTQSLLPAHGLPSSPVEKQPSCSQQIIPALWCHHGGCALGSVPCGV